LTPAYFVTVKGNLISGVSRRSQIGAVSVNSVRKGNNGKYNAVSVYGVDIKDNRIIGNPALVPIAKTEAPPYNGVVTTAVYYSTDTMTDNKAGDTTNLIIENNRLDDISNGGIVMTKANYGHVLQGNLLVNVNPQVDINNLDGPGERIVSLSGSYTDNRAPFFPAGSLLIYSSVTSGEVSLSWAPAVDAVGVTEYRIYANNVLAGTVSANASTYTASGLSSETAYTFTLRGFDAANHESTSPLYVKVTTLPLPKSQGKPDTPELSDDNGDDTGLLDGSYHVAMNMWYGNNGTRYRLYENDVLIREATLTDDAPHAQSLSTTIEGKPNGAYRYDAELINSFGTTTSSTHVVQVTQATPNAPELSHNNWSGSGNFEVTMNMWWGTNGDTYKLYENGLLIDTQSLTNHSPSAQIAATSMSNKSVGTYEYRGELVNAAGTTSSDLITVSVTH